MAGPTTARRGAAKNGKSKSSGAARSSGSSGSPRRPKPSRSPSSGTPRRGRAPRRSGPGGPRARLRSGARGPLVWAVVSLLSGAAAIWVLYGSGWLRVTQVEVSGTTVLTAAQVREAARVPLGDPLASVDTDAIEERLLTRLKRIESVDVVRSWPHAIGLKVTERRPKVLLEKSGKFIEIDGTGVRFATVDQAVPGVPRLVVESSGSPAGRRFGVERLEREAARVAADLPAEVRRDTRAIRVRSYDSITVELTDDRTIAWGSGERGEAKARTLVALLKAAGGAKHFDVSAPAAPAVSGS